MDKHPSTSRRRFIRDAAFVAAGLSLQSPLYGQHASRTRAIGNKLNLGFIGPGGRGGDNMNGLVSENVVALCDVDDARARYAYKKHPNAARYRDFREMLDKEESLDAVVVSTPDHTHAVAAIAAMQRGLHVYCEKPLAHSIYEARRMREEAKKAGVVTQMGQQGHAMEGSRRAVEIIRSGAIGQVKELHVWTDRPAGGRKAKTARPIHHPCRTRWTGICGSVPRPLTSDN